MTGLPLLPGYTFQDISVTDYRLPHKLDVLNGFPIVRDTRYSLGRRPIDAVSTRYAEPPNPVAYDPSLTYGRLPRYAYRQFVPHYAIFTQKCLCFKAFFRQAVFNSPNEHYRVRHVNIIYYLENDTLCIIEPVVDNAGFQQGTLVKRHRVPKNVKGDPFIWKDFNIGIDVCIYGVIYHIADCDPFTREFLTSQGIDVGEKENLPIDPYIEQRQVKYRTKLTKIVDDPRRRFLEYDGMVLTFDATWNDDRYRVMYFLIDNTIAIAEVHERNDGKDPVALLLKRTRVPKDCKNLPPNYPRIYLEYGDPEVIEYCTPRDFTLGETILLFGRKFLLHDCDAFTRKYYSDVLGTPQPSAVPRVTKEKPMPVFEVPPHIQFGSPDDTYASCLSFLPKQPRKNVIRQLANFSKKLRYSLRMDAVHPEDEDRDFILIYTLHNGAIQINEIEKSNSGRREGCFLAPTLVPKPNTGRDDPLYYTPQDFFIGARINMFHHRFIITGADLFVYRYVETNRDKFCQEVRENLRNYFIQQGMLRDDVDAEVKKIQEAENQRKILANDVTKAVEDDAKVCTDEISRMDAIQNQSSD